MSEGLRTVSFPVAGMSCAACAGRVEKALSRTAGVFKASVNLAAAFRFTATKVGRETALSQIVKMVEEAQGSKAPIQRRADRISGVFVPVVMAIATITFFVWLVSGPEPAFTFALLNFVAVLIVACPCAMGLATPTSIMVGTGRGPNRAS